MTGNKVYSQHVYDSGSKYIDHSGEGEVAGIVREGSRL